MMQKVVQGPRSRQPLSSSEFRNDRLAAWLHDTGSSWNAAQSSETQGALPAHSFPPIVPPGSPLLSSSTTASSGVSDCSPQSRVPVPQPLGLSDPASLTGNTRSSTALLVGTGTWFANLSSRAKKSPEACCPEPPPQLQPQRRLNASFREILFNNPDYAERLIHTVQGISSENRNILFDQNFDTIAFIGGGGNIVQHNANSSLVSTSATDRPRPSSVSSNKRKAPSGINQRDVCKAPCDISGPKSTEGSSGGHHQNKKTKTRDFLYLCPYRQAYHLMSPQHKFRSCQPPGHIKDRSQFKRHLKEVHVRTQGIQNSKANHECERLASNLNLDYAMDEALWENKVVGIFDNAQSKRFTRGSEDWLRNERTCYEEVWKIILPNQPIPTSPFYEDSVNGHPLVEVARRRLEPVFREKANRAVQSGQVASAEDYRPSQEEAMDMMAVALATLLSTRPELSQQIKDLTQSQTDSDHLPPLTEDTRSTTPATSSRSHVPGTTQGPPTSTITAPQLAKISHQTTITDTDADQQDLEAFHGMGGNAETESPGMAFMGQPLHTTGTNPPQMRTTSEPQVYVHFDIEPCAFEITLKGRAASDHFGTQKWEIAVPKGLIVEKCEQRQVELPTNYGQPAMCGGFQTGVTSLDPRVQGTGDGSFALDGGWSELADISSNFFEGAQGTCPDSNN